MNSQELLATYAQLRIGNDNQPWYKRYIRLFRNEIQEGDATLFKIELRVYKTEESADSFGHMSLFSLNLNYKDCRKPDSSGAYVFKLYKDKDIEKTVLSIGLFDYEETKLWLNVIQAGLKNPKIVNVEKIKKQLEEQKGAKHAKTVPPSSPPHKPMIKPSREEEHTEHQETLKFSTSEDMKEEQKGKVESKNEKNIEPKKIKEEEKKMETEKEQKKKEIKIIYKSFVMPPTLVQTTFTYAYLDSPYINAMEMFEKHISNRVLIFQVAKTIPVKPLFIDENEYLIMHTVPLNSHCAYIIVALDQSNSLPMKFSIRISTWCGQSCSSFVKARTVFYAQELYNRTVGIGRISDDTTRAKFEDFIQKNTTSEKAIEEIINYTNDGNLDDLTAMVEGMTFKFFTGPADGSCALTHESDGSESDAFFSINGMGSLKICRDKPIEIDRWMLQELFGLTEKQTENLDETVSMMTGEMSESSNLNLPEIENDPTFNLHNKKEQYRVLPILKKFLQILMNKLRYPVITVDGNEENEVDPSVYEVLDQKYKDVSETLVKMAKVGSLENKKSDDELKEDIYINAMQHCGWGSMILSSIPFLVKTLKLSGVEGVDEVIQNTSIDLDGSLDAKTQGSKNVKKYAHKMLSTKASNTVEVQSEENIEEDLDIKSIRSSRIYVYNVCEVSPRKTECTLIASGESEGSIAFLPPLSVEAWSKACEILSFYDLMKNGNDPQLNSVVDMFENFNCKKTNDDLIKNEIVNADCSAYSLFTAMIPNEETEENYIEKYGETGSLISAFRKNSDKTPLCIKSSRLFKGVYILALPPTMFSQYNSEIVSGNDVKYSNGCVLQIYPPSMNERGIEVYAPTVKERSDALTFAANIRDEICPKGIIEVIDLRDLQSRFSTINQNSGTINSKMTNLRKSIQDYTDVLAVIHKSKRNLDCYSEEIDQFNNMILSNIEESTYREFFTEKPENEKYKMLHMLSINTMSLLWTYVEKFYTGYDYSTIQTLIKSAKSDNNENETINSLEFDRSQIMFPPPMFGVDASCMNFIGCAIKNQCYEQIFGDISYNEKVQFIQGVINSILIPDNGKMEDVNTKSDDLVLVDQRVITKCQQALMAVINENKDDLNIEFEEQREKLNAAVNSFCLQIKIDENGDIIPKLFLPQYEANDILKSDSMVLLVMKNPFGPSWKIFPWVGRGIRNNYLKIMLENGHDAIQEIISTIMYPFITEQNLLSMLDIQQNEEDNEGIDLDIEITKPFSENCEPVFFKSQFINKVAAETRRLNFKNRFLLSLKTESKIKAEKCIQKEDLLCGLNMIQKLTQNEKKYLETVITDSIEGKSSGLEQLFVPNISSNTVILPLEFAYHNYVTNAYLDHSMIITIHNNGTAFNKIDDLYYSVKFTNQTWRDLKTNIDIPMTPDSTFGLQVLHLYEGSASCLCIDYANSKVGKLLVDDHCLKALKAENMDPKPVNGLVECYVYKSAAAKAIPCMNIEKVILPTMSMNFKENEKINVHTTHWSDENIANLNYVADVLMFHRELGTESPISPIRVYKVVQHPHVRTSVIISEMTYKNYIGTGDVMRLTGMAQYVFYNENTGRFIIHSPKELDETAAFVVDKEKINFNNDSPNNLKDLLIMGTRISEDNKYIVTLKEYFLTAVASAFIRIVAEKRGITVTVDSLRDELKSSQFAGVIDSKIQLKKIGGVPCTKIDYLSYINNNSSTDLLNIVKKIVSDPKNIKSTLENIIPSLNASPETCHDAFEMIKTENITKCNKMIKALIENPIFNYSKRYVDGLTILRINRNGEASRIYPVLSNDIMHPTYVHLIYHSYYHEKIFCWIPRFIFNQVTVGGSGAKNGKVEMIKEYVALKIVMNLQLSQKITMEVNTLLPKIELEIEGEESTQFRQLFVWWVNTQTNQENLPKSIEKYSRFTYDYRNLTADSSFIRRLAEVFIVDDIKKQKEKWYKSDVVEEEKKLYNSWTTLNKRWCNDFFTLKKIDVSEDILKEYSLKIFEKFKHGCCKINDQLGGSEKSQKDIDKAREIEKKCD